ncbi:MAG: hypothetical protein RLZZ93_262 [Actinomycetota bacterium]
MDGPGGTKSRPVRCGRFVTWNSLPEMHGKRHLVRGVAAVTLVLSSLVAPAAAVPVRHDLAPAKVDPRYQMPGYSFRSRDDLAVDAVAALAIVMRQDNVDDPMYLGLRRLVSDEIAERMSLDADRMHRAWSRAPRDHQIAGLAAISQIGVRYVEGKEDPYVQMDCSGLQWYAWRTAGLDMPRQAVSQQDRHMRIEREDAVFGDIVGEGTHVHLYLGVSLAMIHAPFNGKKVKLKMMSEAQASRSVWADPSLIALYRL